MNRKQRKEQKSGMHAFVIMPFNATGSEGHNHYLSIYQDYIKPVAVELEINVLRADEVSESGSITADLIKHLAEDQIVIADLTELNPNVYYELGVRHALCRNGTILILDELKTSHIPFDLADFRVIKFKSNPKGLATLKENLTSFLSTAKNFGKNVRGDNPVQLWLEGHGIKTPSRVTTSSTAEVDESNQAGNSDIRNLLEDAIAEAENDLTPKKIINKAEDAVKDEDLIKFLNCVQDFISLETFLPSEREYANLYFLANRIDARSKVAESILKLGIEIFPSSDVLLGSYISHLAHSPDKSQREKAKQIVQEKLELKFINGKASIENITNIGENVQLLPLMLDAYHRDGQHQEAFDITSSLVEAHPESTVALRNYARAMEKLGRYSVDEIIEAHRKAVLVPFIEEASARWYGTTLKENGRMVAALEAYLLACMLDLDDSKSFSSLALALSDVVQPRNLLNLSQIDRELPSEINRAAVIKSIILAIDCTDHGVEEKTICETAMRNIGFGIDELQEQMDATGDTTRTDRRHFVEPLYEKLKSRVTLNIP